MSADVKNWKPFYRFIALPIVGIVSSIIFDLGLFGKYYGGTLQIIVGLSPFLSAAIFGLLGGAISAELGAGMDRKYGGSAGFLILGFMGAALGGIINFWVIAIWY